MRSLCGDFSLLHCFPLCRKQIRQISILALGQWNLCDLKLNNNYSVNSQEKKKQLLPWKHGSTDTRHCNSPKNSSPLSCCHIWIIRSPLSSQWALTFNLLSIKGYRKRSSNVRLVLGFFCHHPQGLNHMEYFEYSRFQILIFHYFLSKVQTSLQLSGCIHNFSLVTIKFTSIVFWRQISAWEYMHHILYTSLQYKEYCPWHVQYFLLKLQFYDSADVSDDERVWNLLLLLPVE